MLRYSTFIQPRISDESPRKRKCCPPAGFETCSHAGPYAPVCLQGLLTWAASMRRTSNSTLHERVHPRCGGQQKTPEAMQEAPRVKRVTEMWMTGTRRTEIIPIDHHPHHAPRLTDDRRSVKKKPRPLWRPVQARGQGRTRAGLLMHGTRGPQSRESPSKVKRFLKYKTGFSVWNWPQSTNS